MQLLSIPFQIKPHVFHPAKKRETMYSVDFPFALLHFAAGEIWWINKLESKILYSSFVLFQVNTRTWFFFRCNYSKCYFVGLLKSHKISRIAFLFISHENTLRRNKRKQPFLSLCNSIKRKIREKISSGNNSTGKLILNHSEDC